MKPRIFFDTNIMLDLIQERPGYQYAARLLQMQEDGEITVCISILSMANIAYVLRKTIPQNLIVQTLKQISSIVEVIPMDNDQLQSALLMEGPDFEDIMQAACAASCSVGIVSEASMSSAICSAVCTWLWFSDCTNSFFVFILKKELK